MNAGPVALAAREGCARAHEACLPPRRGRDAQTTTIEGAGTPRARVCSAWPAPTLLLFALAAQRSSGWQRTGRDGTHAICAAIVDVISATITGRPVGARGAGCEREDRARPEERAVGHQNRSRQASRSVHRRAPTYIHAATIASRDAARAPLLAASGVL